MNIADIIVIGVCVLILGGATAYILLSKKKGRGCIGCPYAGFCGGRACGGKADKDGKG